MLRTLHTFLSRELAKVTLLALVAFTLVMTVFAIIEPLRKQGLATDQVLALIGYTLPVMVSLTLPIAALFAATIVYGRLSQDNELTACRASGIAAVSLLKPALALGLLVTAASLWLSNSVAPRLAEAGELAVKANVRGIVYHQITSSGYFKHGAFLVHADAVDGDRDTLRGVVFAQARDPNDVLLVSAQSTRVLFRSVETGTYAGIQMDEPVVTSTGAHDIAQQEYAPIDSLPLPKAAKEDPAWYGWDRLVRVLDHPAENAEIRRILHELRRDLAYEMLAREVTEVIGSGQPYTGLSGPRSQCEITAPRAVQDGWAVELASAADPSGARLPVRVRVREGSAVSTYEAGRGRLEAAWSERRNDSVVSIRLTEDVRVRVETGDGSSTQPATEPAWTERKKAQVGDMSLPRHLLAAMERIDPNGIVRGVEQLTENPAIRARVRDLTEVDIYMLRGKILAEMHGRIAYGVSCFLLVSMGAAMGLLFRGGQIISAFALSVMPAAVVVVLLLMGKEMVANPGVAKPLGLAAIWGGIAALVIGNALLYLRLARR